MSRYGFDLRRINRKIEQFKREQARPVRQRIEQLEREIDELRGVLMELEGTNGTAPAKAASSAAAAARGPRRRKRERRGPEQLKKYAEDAFEYIKSHPGTGGGDVRRQFPKIGQDIKGFIAKHSDHKVRTTGKMAQMTYHVA